MLYCTKNLYTIPQKLFSRRKWYENARGFLIGFESFSLRECRFEHRYASDIDNEIREKQWAQYSYQTREISDAHDPETPPHEEFSEIIGMARISPEACLNNFSFVIGITTKSIHLSISDIFKQESDYPESCTKNKLQCHLSCHKKERKRDDTNK